MIFLILNIWTLNLAPFPNIIRKIMFREFHMSDKTKIIYSSLQQCCTREGHALEILIFRAENETEWLLEVVDAGGKSSVWDVVFPTDKEALEEALREINEEGTDDFLTTILPSRAH